MSKMALNTRTHEVKNLGKYKCLLIRESDGAQCFKALHVNYLVDRVIWLKGSDRAAGVRAEMVGEIHYHSSYTRGQHVFVKDERECFI